MCRAILHALTCAGCGADLRVEKVRFAAVQRMTKAFRPHLHVAEVARVLGFAAATGPTTEVTPEEVDDCQEWLAAHGATVVSDKGDLLLDTKVSRRAPNPAPFNRCRLNEDNLATGRLHLWSNDCQTHWIHASAPELVY